jgi:hypothetical protein
MFRSPRNIQSYGHLLQSNLRKRTFWVAQQRYCIVFSSFITTASSSLTRRNPIPIWPRRLRSLFYASIFGGLGFYLGNQIANRTASPPVPGTEEDAHEMKQIRDAFESLPVVKELRSDPKFREWEAYSSLSETEKQPRLTSVALKGSRGLALQASFIQSLPSLVQGRLDFFDDFFDG